MEKKKVDKGPPPELGMIYRDRPITGLHSFGAFVEVTEGHEGLVHVTELDIKKVLNPEEEFKMGQMVDVIVLGNTDKGKLRLSRRAVMLRDENGGSPLTAKKAE